MPLPLETAFKLVQYAINAGGRNNIPIAVAVVDMGGRVLAAARCEQVGFVNLAVAERKACAALNFKTPTHAVLDMLKGDGVALTAVMNEPTLCLLPGGLPIVIGGAIAGAIGIAGGHYSQDQTIAEESLASLPRP